jgi:hypothetical protein
MLVHTCFYAESFKPVPIKQLGAPLEVIVASPCRRGHVSRKVTLNYLFVNFLARRDLC